MCGSFLSEINYRADSLIGSQNLGNDTTESFGYSYDGMGNRLTSSSGTGSGVSARAYTPDALNQYDAITHDGKVNVLTRSDAAVTATAANATHNGVDQAGNLYIAEVFNGRVQKFRPKPGADAAKVIGQEVRLSSSSDQ